MQQTLEQDDVVFMYAAADATAYTDYGATVVGWGGAHTRATVAALTKLGIHPTGTMWCLTAGAKLLHDNEDLRDAVARDLNGEPIAVPWLHDHTYEGTPSWFGCTNQPAFRARMRATVCEAMAGGAAGLHVDDPLCGAQAAINFGGCFCDACIRGFAAYLGAHDCPEWRRAAGMQSFAQFDYRQFVRGFADTRAKYQEVRASIPLYGVFVDWQIQCAVENLGELHDLACRIAGHPVTLSANVCLQALHYLPLAPACTYLVAEIAHHAAEGTARLGSTVWAYRAAEALDRPVAATAFGWDWAFVNEKRCENLVRLWIALSYACGQRLMAPHRMWCYTEQKGTHWYDGPTTAYAPLYRFVRAHRELFHDTRTVGPLVVPTDLPRDLATAAGREAFRVALGDPAPLAPQPHVWAFPRQAADGRGLVHLLNLDYDAATDRFTPQTGVTVSLPATLFGRPYSRAMIHRFDAEPVAIGLEAVNGEAVIRVPELPLWAVVELLPAP